MNATSTPQAAAAEARKTYRDDREAGSARSRHRHSRAVRSMAENSVDQTRAAYDRSTDAFDASVATFERSFDAAGQGAVAFNRKIIDIARRNRVRASISPRAWRAPRA